MTSQPRSILFVCGGSYVSGMEIVELTFMAGLAERGHRVHALISGWNDGDFAARLTAAGIPHTEAFTGKLSLRRPDWMANTLRHWPGARRVARRLVGSFRPDLVVIANRDSVMLLDGVWGGAPVVHHVQELMTPRWTQAVDRRVAHFLTASEAVSDEVVARGVARSRVTAVHSGVYDAPPAPSAGDPPAVGICGQIGEWKGHDDLVDALARVGAQGLPFRLRIYGRGAETYEQALRQRIAARGLAEHVDWMGFERDPDRMYAGLDIVAIPSRSADPFPTTVLEAGVRGLPVVCTRRGGMPEAVVEGETGVLAMAEDPASLAEALTPLLDDAGRRRAMGEAARRHIRNRFLVPHAVERFEAAMALPALQAAAVPA